MYTCTISQAHAAVLSLRTRKMLNDPRHADSFKQINRQPSDKINTAKYHDEADATLLDKRLIAPHLHTELSRPRTLRLCALLPYERFGCWHLALLAMTGWLACCRVGLLTEWEVCSLQFVSWSGGLYGQCPQCVGMARYGVRDGVCWVCGICGGVRGGRCMVVG
ncbi:uncharacterized protein EKO05_0002658 [Ascochyta rabiei]|uniref:uncharacterized protein n=1 Tax=Didymella rabiei TaxID=5454 RepID=UPI0021FDEFF2|nr:uncharacterized protein EKO05_0002658 [Ascochyta rabiei]UPX12085.1 hypothetical protein EKO05_0002658 [Ascochyta rabiei]